MDPVLVGFGDHERSSSVVRWGHELAKLAGASMTVVSVVEDLSTEHQPGERDETGLEMRRTAVERALAGADASDAEIDVRLGDPIEEFVDAADEHHASLLVVGARETPDDDDPGGFGLHLLQRGHRAVAVVPDSYETLEGGKFVVGIDGSKANGPALMRAAELARAAHGSLTAVFAYDPLDDTFVLPEGWHRHSDEVRAELKRVRSVPVDLVMEPGSPDEVLREIAAREHAAAIVVGTRGPHLFSRSATGRVPEHLLHKGDCPTIAVPH